MRTDNLKHTEQVCGNAEYQNVKHTCGSTAKRSCIHIHNNF